MQTLLIAEHNNQGLTESTYRTLTAASEIEQDIHVLVAGHQVHQIAVEASMLPNVKKVLVADDESLIGYLAESMALLLFCVASQYRTMIAPSSAIMRACMPRAAALLNVMQISDVVQIMSYNTFKRYIYAGKIVQVIKSQDPIQLLTVRTSAFSSTINRNKSAAPIDSLEIPQKPSRTATLLSFKPKDTQGLPELSTAKIVVAGGRSLNSRNNFMQYLQPLARILGAAIGATRAAVDAGYAPSEWQIGQTGIAVAPDVYIAIGISGAIQHICGMKDSKVIIAINNDKDAPIFKIATYGIIGDLYEIVPQLCQELTQKIPGGDCKIDTMMLGSMCENDES